MIRYLPLFPLSIVVFPGENLNLHIFEPRYKQLISDCLTSETTFIIPPFIDNKVAKLGTEIKILKIEKTYPNGEMDIKTKGLGIYKILDFFKQAPNKFYPAGNVEAVNQPDNGDTVLRSRIKANIRQLYSILGIKKLLLDLPDNYKLFQIAHHLGLTLENEYELLEAPDERSRQNLVYQHLQTIMPLILETEKLKDRVRLNGHFKHLEPPMF